jgi:hypothetical protein
MRKWLKKLTKEEKEIVNSLNKEILDSRDYQTLGIMNQVINLMDEIQKYGFRDETTPLGEAYKVMLSQAVYFHMELFTNVVKMIDADKGKDAEAQPT